jgi:CDP-diacylglycerol--serine O-phosphatidyltransferase
MKAAASAIRLANMLTYASLMCGVGTLSMALQQNAAACGALLALAVVFDTFDGRFARYVRQRLGGEASLGAELDSLVDAVTFGIVPIACASVLFGGEGLLWWVSAFTYVACAVTRLGVYNVSSANAPESANVFVGLPTPVAALFWSSLFLIRPEGGVLIAVALASAMAMISPLRIRRPDAIGLAFFVFWPVVLVVVHVSRL